MDAYEQLKLSSQEIEAELEAELEARAALCAETEQKLAKASSANEELANTLRELESRLEEAETQLRVKDTSLLSLEAENEQLLEKLALQDVDQTEMQRLKQDLSEAQEEISALKRATASTKVGKEIAV